MFTRANACWLAVIAVALVLVGANLAMADDVGGCPGDYDCNGRIDFFDVDLLLAALGGETIWADKYQQKFGTPPPCDYLASCDANGDGVVDAFDIDRFLANIGKRWLCATPGAMVFIPAGEFEMGDTFDEGESDERPVHTVNLGAYSIDAYVVTKQQYVDALNWARTQGNLISVEPWYVYQYGTGTSYPYCKAATYTDGKYITWNGSEFRAKPGTENHPMLFVSWYGAVAFCNWRSAMEGRPLCYDLSTWECDFNVPGYRLPTEAEWEKAARGGATGHRFPWADTDTIQHARANYFSSSSVTYDTSPTRGYHPEFGEPLHTNPVGYFAPNGYGMYDMAGNVGEWCHDWYSGSYYSGSPTADPAGPTAGTYRVLRGGGWCNGAQNCRVATRHNYSPDGLFGFYGFRCALGTPEAP